MSYGDIYLHNALTGAQIDTRSVRGLAVLICSHVKLNHYDSKERATGGGLYDIYTPQQFRTRPLSRIGCTAVIYRGTVFNGHDAQQEIDRLCDRDEVMNRDWYKICGEFALVDDGSDEGALWVPVFVNEFASPSDADDYAFWVACWASDRAVIEAEGDADA